MPTDSPRNAVARQWEVLKALPNAGRGKTAEELQRVMGSRGYKTSLRTLQRDLAALQSLFPITATDEKPFLWRWSGTSELAVAGLSVPDALALNLLERFISPLLPASVTKQLDAVFRVASSKLQKQRRNELVQWSSLVAVADRGIQVVPPKIDETVISTIQECLIAGDKAALSYVKADGTKRSQRVLSPLGLVQNGAITYLVAHTEDHAPPEGVIQLAMHRVGSAKRVYETAYRPPDFSLQGFIDKGGLEFGLGGQINLRARISDMLTKQLQDTRLSADQKIASTPHGNILSASVKNTWRLKWWILEKSGDIEVLAPAALRREVGETLQMAASNYVRSIQK